MTAQTIERAISPQQMRLLAARASRRHPNLTGSDDVFIAFALGQERRGRFASAEHVDGEAEAYDPQTQTGKPIDPALVLRSHGIAIAVSLRHWVVFAARPAAPGQPCLGRVMAHAGRAAVFVYAVLADDRVFSFDRADFTELCDRYAIAEAQPPTVYRRPVGGIGWRVAR